MLFAFIFSREFVLAPVPDTVYSLFHIASYLRARIIPAILADNRNTKPLQGAISSIVNKYYDGAMICVCFVEIGLWLHILACVLSLRRGTWILWCVYTVFLRMRYKQVEHMAKVQRKLKNVFASMFEAPNTPRWLKQCWGSVESVVGQAVEITDLSNYKPSAEANEIAGEDKKNN
jgi:transmembrane protein 33